MTTSYPKTAIIVGCGRMGIRHAAVLEKLKIDILGLADPIDKNIEVLTNNLTRNKSITKHPDLRSALKSCTPDLVVISTTANAHYSQALEAISAGVKLLLIEKPICTSLSDSENLIKLSESNNVRIAVNHQMRFLPIYTKTKQIINSEEFGGLQSMNILAGNFGMAMNAIHYFEAFRYLSGEPAESISAWLDPDEIANPRGPEFKDVSGCLRFTSKSGYRFYLDASMSQGHGVQSTYMTRNGRVTIDELTGKIETVVRKKEYLFENTSRYGMPININNYEIKPVELIDSTSSVLKALIQGENYPNLRDAQLAIKTLICAYHSSRNNGKEILINSVSNNDNECFPWA